MPVALPIAVARLFVAIALLTLCLPSRPVLSAEPLRILVLETMTLPFLQDTTTSLRAELSSLGRVDGTDVSYTVLNAEGDIGTAKDVLSDALKNGDPHLVITVATLATRVGRELLGGTDIPQVFTVVADPVGEGLVAKIGERTGANITGRSHVVPAAAKLAVVAKALSGRSGDGPFRIGLLHSDYPSAVSETATLIKTAAAFPQLELFGLSFPYRPGEAGRPAMRAAALQAIEDNRSRLDGLWLPSGPTALDEAYVETVAGAGVPMIYAGNLMAVRRGALVALLSTAEINGKATAHLANAVLDGALAASLPVERAGRFAAGINAGTAKRLDVAIPSELLELARENIFR